MLKLTMTNTKSVIYVNPNLIAAMLPNTEVGGTVIFIGNQTYSVRQTPDQILLQMMTIKKLEGIAV